MVQVQKAALPVLVVVVCLLLSFDGVSDFFVYRRSGLFSGEYWRFISGNFVHINWQHLWLNLAAWLLIWIYGASVCTAFMWLLSLLFCAAGVSVGLLLWLPGIEEYSGLSGVLHGLFIVVAGLRLLVQRNDYSAWGVLAVVAAKLVYESSRGGLEITGTWIGLPVVSEAHLYGTASGAVVAAAMILIAMVKKQRGRVFRG